MTRILAISGSLRAASSNRTILEATKMLASPDCTVTLYEKLGQLPHFNPDLDVDPLPEPVLDLRREVGQSDGIIICSPEYAHGVPGSLKNALDWLVSSFEFPDKPVALFNSSPRSTHAQAQLREILKTMSARLVERACIAISLPSKHISAHDIATDQPISGLLRTALTVFAEESKVTKLAD